MTKNHMGQTLRKLMTDRNISVTRMTELSGRTRQQVHGDFHRVTVKDDILEVYAKALNIDKEHFYSSSDVSPVDQESFGGKVLEDIKRMIEDELREKNDQIRALQESLKDAQAIIKMALGKPDLGEDTPCVALNSLFEKRA